MGIVDAFYDIRPRRLVWLALAIAALANAAWLFFGPLGWGVVAAVWLIIAALSLAAHRWDARWVLATAPAALICPVLLAMFMQACTTTNSCP